MKGLLKVLVGLLFYFIAGMGVATADNQTNTLSPILPASGLPFRIVVEQATFQLPVGFHSGVVGEYHQYWVLIAGRINGLHGFGGPIPPNFPPDQQNTSIYVVDSATGTVYSRSLSDAGSGLTQQQIDTLSVTSPQGYQDGTTFYMTGGYGFDTATSTYSTKAVLTAVNLPGIIEWVIKPNNKNNSVAKNIRQINHPIFQITGGKMYKLGNITQLVFGQNFIGAYTPGSNGDYSQQVRRFQIKNIKGKLSVIIYPSMPHNPDPNFRRRDLNVVPTLLTENNLLKYGLVAYAGVFTLTSGVWNVPVVINGTNNPVMADPLLPDTFKQGMNHYACATAALYSRKSTNMYHIFFGGLSFGYFSGGSFQTDSEVPFINQITTVQMDKSGHFTQYIMDDEYPVILSTGSNPGNPLLFGAGSFFVPASIQHYANRVINLDNIRQPTVIGYIVGGIQSTLPNTNTTADSAASPYVFKVTLIPT